MDGPDSGERAEEGGGRLLDAQVGEWMHRY